MTDFTSNDTFSLFISFLLCTVICGWRGYIAWYKPEQHQKFLNRIGSIFAVLPLGGEAFWKSKFNFWYTRINFSIGFLVGIGGTLFLIIKFIISLF